jgi:hypothetical protein
MRAGTETQPAGGVQHHRTKPNFEAHYAGIVGTGHDRNDRDGQRGRKRLVHECSSNYRSKHGNNAAEDDAHAVHKQSAAECGDAKQHSPSHTVKCGTALEHVFQAGNKQRWRYDHRGKAQAETGSEYPAHPD